MKVVPRWYQSEAVQSIYDYFGSNREGNPLVAMPTGTGKGVVIAQLLESILKQWPMQKIVNVTHVQELVEQNHLKLLEVWPQAPAGVNSAGLGRRDWNKSIIFAGIGSIAKTPEKLGHVDLFIIDEAHLVSPDTSTMYQKVIAALLEINPYLRVIGLTATPWRLGHGRLIDPSFKGDVEIPPLFTDVCYDLTGFEPFNRLIAEGYIAPLVPKKTELILDTESVHMRGGEYIASELQAAVDIAEVTEAAIREIMEVGQDRRHWLIFASGVEHAIHVSEMLNMLGIPSVAIHSKLGKVARREALADYKAGRYRAAVNNNVLTTGFDFPGIDLIGVLRPTESPVLWVQMLGRGTRPVYAPGHDLGDISGRLAAIQASHKQNCLVLDFANNTKRLGPINDPVIPRRKGKGGGDAPVRLCELCDTWNHASLRFCCNCGAEFPRQVKIVHNAGTAELIKGELPKVEVFPVDQITYTRHVKAGSVPTMKVTYYSGLKMFMEFVCLEHEGRALKKAERWWSERTTVSFPGDVNNAIALSSHIKAATHLRVWVNKKHPEIMAHCFDGTAFGEQPGPSVAEMSAADDPIPF